MERPTPSPPAPLRPRVPPPPRELTESEIRVIAELIMLEDRRTLDSARIGTLLEHWSPEVRRRAALAAGRIGDRRATPLLLEALQDSTPGVALHAAFALGELGDTAEVVVRALAAKLATADSTAVEAVIALTQRQTAASFEVVRQLIAEGPADGAGVVHQNALLYFWRFPQAASMPELLEPWVASPDTAFRWRAVYSLVRGGWARGVPLLLRVSEDEDPLIRSLAMRGLRLPQVDSAGVRAAAQAALAAGTRAAHPHVRINAAGALGTWPDEVRVDAVAPLLNDPDANVRVAAALALGNARSPVAARALRQIVADSMQRFGVRSTALASLARVDPAQAVEEAIRWSASHRWLLRMHAARALGVVRDPAAAAPLESLAADPDWRVVRTAFNSIRQREDTTARAYALYLQGLRARDPRVRAVAIAAIGRQATPRDLALLLDVYDEAQSDSLPDAALAAVDALASLQRQGVPVANAFFARFRPPRDPDLRARIERRLGRGWNGAVTVDDRRRAAFYEDVVRTLVAPGLAGRPGPRLRIVTEEGEIVIELHGADAPLTVHNMISLVESGYFDAGIDPDSRRWHRVVPNFVLQDGDPRGDGSGNPGYAIRDEINRRRYTRGVLGMALSGPDTGGSQFFITHSPQPHLDGGYTIFGTVVSGMDVADRVVQEDRIMRMEILK